MVREVFGTERALIGMVHVGALPGTPYARMGIDELAARAGDAARILARAGFDGVLIENMHDLPYVLGEAIGAEIVACMTRIACEVRASVEIPVGVQILAAGNRQALAVAVASGAAFIRVEGYVFGHVADEGLIAPAEAGPLLRYRRQIGGERVRIFADIRKKHASHAITGDLSIAEHARSAAFFGADALVVTGTHTGEEVDRADVARAAEAGVPIVVGSGASEANARDLLGVADAIIVGSSIKVEGRWQNEVDAARASAFVRAARG